MKTTPFLNDLLDKLSPLGAMARSMMGDYCLYCEGVLVGLVCDDELFLKQFPQNQAVLERCEKRPPYPTAKPYYVVDTSDVAFLNEAITLTVSGAKSLAKNKKGR